VQVVAEETSAEEQQQKQRVMSFLIRSRNSQKWGRSGTTSAATSFSVRTGRRTSGESDSVVLRSGGLRDLSFGMQWAPSSAGWKLLYTQDHALDTLYQQQEQQQMWNSIVTASITSTACAHPATA
jgi:hypothetical protein